MTDHRFQVIDLTDSFTLVDHSALSNIVIELDDTFSEPNISHEVPIETPMGVSNLYTPDENGEAHPSQQRKKSKNPRKKIRRLQQPTAKSSIEVIRERSPLGNHIGDCPICLEKIGTNPLSSTKCGHVFCQQCLIQALRLEKKCPTCRKPLRGNSAYHPLFLNRG